LWYNIYTRKEKEINKMKVKLYVNWREKEIITARELEEKIDNVINDVLQDRDVYAAELDDYLDSYYTKIELFEALSDERINKEKFINEIREGVEEQVRDWNEGNIRSDYEEINIEI
jgi:hypothetical protein